MLYSVLFGRLGLSNVRLLSWLKSPLSKILGLGFLVFFLVAATYWKDVIFYSDTQSTNMPAEITFNFELNDIESDNIYIKTSRFDESGFKVDRKGKTLKANYNYPGYFKAKLYVDNKPIKSTDVYVKSKGWVASLGDYDNPRYLNSKELLIDDRIRISDRLLSQLNNSSSPEHLTYHYFDQINPISGLDFIFETQFRSTYQNLNGVCQNLMIDIQGTNSHFSTPFSIPGCIANEKLTLAGRELWANQNDLTGFGTDMDKTQAFKLIVKKGLALYYLNNKLILKEPVRRSIGQIVGFRFRFLGSGEVDFVKLTDTRDIIYVEPF